MGSIAKVIYGGLRKIPFVHIIIVFIYFVLCGMQPNNFLYKGARTISDYMILMLYTDIPPTLRPEYSRSLCSLLGADDPV